MSEEREIQEIIDVIGKKIEKKYGCIDVSEFNDKDWTALRLANNIAEKGVRYGISEGKTLHKGTNFSWSNAEKQWFSGRSVPKGREVRLDANEMIVPISPERGKRISCYIKELPLYYASFEAKLKGEVSPREALDVFAEGKGISDLLDKLPMDKREEIRKEIKEKGWGWFFGKRE